jgi:hypothetical protein
LKRLSVVLLVLGLLLLCSSGALALRHGNEGEGTNEGNYSIDTRTDTWYSIAPTAPYWQAAYRHVGNMDVTTFFGEWYQKDQLFVSAKLVDVTGGGTELRASYLFNFGLFLGLDYLSPDPGSNTTWFSPGFRFDLGDDSYLALSADYYSSASVDEIRNYDLDLKYYTEMMFVFAEINATKSAYTNYDFGLNYQVNDLWVLGAKLYFQGNHTGYMAGFTLTTDPAIVDFTYSNDSASDSYYKIGAMFNLTDSIGLGFEYYTIGVSGIDPDYTINFKYLINDNAKFKISYELENDSREAIYTLSYFAQL